MPNDIDWARLAALIEVQSSIHIGERGNSAYLRISVVRANPGLIDWLHQTFGGTALSRKDGASGWHVDCAKAYELLRGCYPYLISKQNQADIAFAYEETLGRRGRGIKTPPEVLDLRKSLREKLNLAKQADVEEDVDLIDEDPASVNDDFLPDMSEENGMTEDQRIIWAAGFFDGEGTTSISRQQHTQAKYLLYQVRVTVSQKVPGPLGVFRDLFGGNLYTYKWKGNDYWYWVASGGRATMMLETLLPFLILKKERAAICIQFQNELMAWNRDYGRRGYPEFVHQAREAYYQRMKFLNQRGVANDNPNPQKTGPKTKGIPKPDAFGRKPQEKEAHAIDNAPSTDVLQ
jgi:hypothetical protein